MVTDTLCTDIPDFDELSGVVVVTFQAGNLVLVPVDMKGLDFPGGMLERGETPEEAAYRQLFETVGSAPLVMGILGVREVSIYVDERPVGYGLPFPKCFFVVYWAVVEDFKSLGSMGMGGAQVLSDKQVKSLDVVKDLSLFYEAGKKMAEIVKDKLSA